MRVRTRNKQLNSKPCIYISGVSRPLGAFSIYRSKRNTVLLSLNATFASAVKCLFREEVLADGESKPIGMLVALRKSILSGF